MGRDHSLGEFERLILLAVLRCRENAYGYTLQQELEKTIHRTFALGAIYTTLERMEQKGLVSSRMSAPSPGRGGRPKRLFTVEGAGVRALNTAEREWRQLATGLEGIIGTA
jgi:PadR family transcriptional regulator, regulatory protein PadR